MPAKPCPICGGQHYVMAEMIPDGRDAVAAVAYRLLRKMARKDRNEHWHRVMDALGGLYATGTGYLKILPPPPMFAETPNLKITTTWALASKLREHGLQEPVPCIHCGAEAYVVRTNEYSSKALSTTVACYCEQCAPVAWPWEEL